MSSPAAQPASSFPIRQMDFAFERRDHYWFGGDPHMTMFANVLSSLFPPGERFFMDSLRAVRHRVEEPELQSDIRAFMGQEAMHSKGHNALNAHLDGQGVDLETLERRTYALLRLVRRVFSPMQQLAITCAIEHFTATLSAHLLRRTDVQDAFVDPEILRLWMWHATEEVEHKALSMDVYRRLGGGEASRIALMGLTTVVMGAVIALWHARLLLIDGHFFSLKTWKYGLRVLLGRQGFITRMIPDLVDYFRPSFHPNDHDTTELLEHAKAGLAAA